MSIEICKYRLTITKRYGKIESGYSLIIKNKLINLLYLVCMILGKLYFNRFVTQVRNVENFWCFVQKLLHQNVYNAKNLLMFAIWH